MKDIQLDNQSPSESETPKDVLQEDTTEGESLPETPEPDQLPPDDEAPVSKEQELSEEQLREPSGDPDDPDDVDKIKADVMKETAQQMIGEVLSPTAKKVAAVAMAPAAIMEDVANTTVDFINFVSTKMGGDKVLENTDNHVSLWVPDDGFNPMIHFGTKLIGSTYVLAGKLKGFNTISKGSLSTLGANAISSMLVDLVAIKPEADAILIDLARKVPYLSDLANYMAADPKEASNFELRVRNSLAGIFEGKILEGVMHSLKFIRKTAVVEDFLEGMSKSADSNRASIDLNKESLKTIATETAGKVKRVSKERLAEFKKIYDSGNGAVNFVNKVDEAGRKTYMNFTQWNVADRIRKFSSNIIEANPTKFKSTSWTDAELIQYSKELNIPKEDFAKWTRDMGLTRGQVLAAQEFGVQTTEAADAMFRAHAAGDPSITTEMLESALAGAEDALFIAKDMKSLAGALLHEGNIAVTGAKSAEKSASVLQRLIKESSSGDVEAAIELYRVKDFSVVEAMVESARLKGSKLSDVLVQMRYAGMLSNPATHARNIIGNVYNVGTRAGESVFAATMNALTHNRQGGVSYGEAYTEMMGAAQGFLEALIITGKKIKGEATDGFIGNRLGADKMPKYLQKSEPAETMTGKAIQFLNESLIQGRFVGKALQYEDDFFKHINARMTLNKEAYRKSQMLGRLRNLDADGIFKEYKKEIAKPSQGTWNKMYGDAEYNTFTNDPQGSLISAVKSVSDHPIARIVAPFGKVNLNSMSYKLERIPGLNFFLERTRSEWTSTSLAVRQRAKAKMTFTASTMSVLGTILHGQDAIEGTGPRDPRKKAMARQGGRLNGAIRVDNQWIEYRSETPQGAILSLVSDLADLRDGSNGDEKFMSEYGSAALSIVVQLYNPEYLTNFVGKLGEAMMSGDANKTRKLLEASSSVLQSYAPYSGAVRQYIRTMTEEGKYVRETFDPSSIITTFSNHVKNIYAPDMLAKKRNRLGYAMKHKTGLGPDLITPYGVGENLDNKVMKEIMRLSGSDQLMTGPQHVESASTGLDVETKGSFITVNMPARIVDNTIAKEAHKIKLGPSEYEKLVQYSTGTFEGDNPKHSLESMLKGIMESDTYKSMSFVDKGTIFHQVISKFDKMGMLRYKNQLDPALRKDFVDMVTNKKLREKKTKDMSFR